MSVFLREIAGTVRRHALSLALVVSAGVLLSGGAALSGSALWWVPALLAAGLALGFVLQANVPVVRVPLSSRCCWCCRLPRR